jgi:hypothetical protein
MRKLMTDVSRRTALIGAVTLASAATTSAHDVASAESHTAHLQLLGDPARAPYGSGVINPNWGDGPVVQSSQLYFERVRDNNGLFMVGDSIMNDTRTEFAQRMWDQHGLYTAVNCRDGRPAFDGVDALEELADYIPDRGVVIGLGTNDIFSPVNWWQQVERVLEIVDGRPVYWVSVFADRWSGSADRRVADMRNSSWVSQQLYAEAVAHPNLEVVDWHAYISTGPNEARVTGWLTDGVHPTNPSGVYGWCNLVAQRMGL